MLVINVIARFGLAFDVYYLIYICVSRSNVNDGHDSKQIIRNII